MHHLNPIMKQIVLISWWVLESLNFTEALVAVDVRERSSNLWGHLHSLLWYQAIFVAPFWFILPVFFYLPIHGRSHLLNRIHTRHWYISSFRRWTSILINLSITRKTNLTFCSTYENSNPQIDFYSQQKLCRYLILRKQHWSSWRKEKQGKIDQRFSERVKLKFILYEKEGKRCHLTK